MKITMLRFFIFCTALSVLLIVSAADAIACSCSRNGTVAEEFARTPNVVRLKLRSIEKAADSERNYGVEGIRQSKLTVEKVFKGNLKVGDELTFAQGGGADCVWTFSEKGIGTEYLFYLGGKPAKGKAQSRMPSSVIASTTMRGAATPPHGEVWTAFTCSRSSSLGYAAADLLYIEKMAKVRGKTRVSGTFTQSIEASVESEESIYRRLDGRSVRISGQGRNIELKTDENGVYEIYDLPAGRYKITPERVEGFKFSGEKTDFAQIEVKPEATPSKIFISRLTTLSAAKCSTQTASR